MIQEFVERWEANKETLRDKYSKEHPNDYKDIVKDVVSVIRDEDDYCSIDPERIHVIDDGDYQGTLLFVIAAGGYQPDTYWYVKVDYGSCSGCDTLESIRSYDDSPPTEQQTKDYMTLATHIVQWIKEME